MPAASNYKNSHTCDCERQRTWTAINHRSHSFHMPIIYQDSFRDDEDVLRVLASIQITDDAPELGRAHADTHQRPPAHISRHCSAIRQPRVVGVRNGDMPPSPPIHMPGHRSATHRPRVVNISDSNDRNRTSIRSPAPQLLPRQRFPGRPEHGVAFLSDRQDRINVRGAGRLHPPEPVPIPQPVVRDDNPYNVVSGRRTGLRETW